MHVFFIISQIIKLILKSIDLMDLGAEYNGYTADLPEQFQFLEYLQQNNVSCIKLFMTRKKQV